MTPNYCKMCIVVCLLGAFDPSAKAEVCVAGLAEGYSSCLRLCGEVAGPMIFSNSMYIATGNGGYNPLIGQYGNSVLRLSLPDLVVRAFTP